MGSNVDTKWFGRFYRTICLSETHFAYYRLYTVFIKWWSADPWGSARLFVLFSYNEKACEMKYKEHRKNTTLYSYILNISQNMFICLESILLIAVRGFISIFLCMWHDLSQMGTSELLGPATWLFVSKSSLDGPIRFKFSIASIVGGVRGPRVCKVLLGGPRTRNIWEPLGYKLGLGKI
jgi:hypothetical protein